MKEIKTRNRELHSEGKKWRDRGSSAREGGEGLANEEGKRGIYLLKERKRKSEEK